MSTSSIADAAVQPSSRQIRRHQFHQPAEALFALAKNFLCPFTLGHVDHDLSSAKEAQAYVGASSRRNPLKPDIRSLQQSETALLGLPLRGRGIEASGGLQ
jgi:hypothetical protein